MNKRDLANKIAKKHDISKQDALWAINIIFDEIEDSLKMEEDVNIVGFGSFNCTQRPERIATNPKTGKTFKLDARKIVTFKLGKHLKSIYK